MATAGSVLGRPGNAVCTRGLSQCPVVHAAQHYDLTSGTAPFGTNPANAGMLAPTVSSYRVGALPVGKLPPPRSTPNSVANGLSSRSRSRPPADATLAAPSGVGQDVVLGGPRAYVATVDGRRHQVREQ